MTAGPFTTGIDSRAVNLGMDSAETYPALRSLPCRVRLEDYMKVQQRWSNMDRRMAWCVIEDDAVYPFGERGEALARISASGTTSMASRGYAQNYEFTFFFDPGPIN